MFFVATIAAGTSLAFTGNGGAAPENDLRWHPATILSSSDHATVLWQVRSAGTVRLRLYREQAMGSEILINEVTTPPGVTSFEFVDENRLPGSAVYVLRVLGGDGSETTLGSAVYVESKFAPTEVSSSVSSFQPAWSQTAIRLPDPRSSSFGDRSALLSRGLIPEPEPPVPR